MVDMLRQEFTFDTDVRKLCLARCRWAQSELSENNRSKLQVLEITNVNMVGLLQIFLNIEVTYHCVTYHFITQQAWIREKSEIVSCRNDV